MLVVLTLITISANCVSCVNSGPSVVTASSYLFEVSYCSVDVDFGVEVDALTSRS